MSYDPTPTRISTALALAATVSVVALVLWQVRLVAVPALVGIVGALAFAASLWVVTRDGLEPFGTVLASLLTVVVAVGVVAGTLGTVISLVGAFFPVSDAAALPGQTARLLGHVGVVTGAVLAVLGAALGVRNVLDADALARYYWLSIKTAIVPAVVAGMLVIGAIPAGRSPGGTTPGMAAGALVGDLLGWLLAPGGSRTHLASLLAVVAVSALSARAALRVLPVAELLGDRGAGRTRTAQVTRARRALGRVAAIGVLGGLIALLVELGAPPATLRRQVGPVAYDLLAAVSAFAPVRATLVGLTVLAVPTVVAGTVLQWLARESVGTLARHVGPLAGGGLVTVGALSVAPPVQRGLVEWTAGRLPGPFAVAFRDLADSVVGFYGSGTVVVVLVTGLVAVTVALVLWVRLGLAVGYLARETAGYSLASGGLFLAVAFAGTVAAPAWLVFGGLVASLFVWDAGRYGTVLGREIGRRAPTSEAELVHAGGTLAVGALGTVGAVALGSGLGPEGLTPSSTTLLALAGALAGVVLLVAALR